MALPAPGSNYVNMANNIATRVANQYGLDPGYFRQVFHAQINQESGFNPNAKSGAGAEGIAQVMPQYHPGVNPYNPQQALNFAANWDAQNVRKYGNWANALSVYNSGKTWDQGQGIAETKNYVNSILGKSGNLVNAAWGEPGSPKGGPPPTGLWNQKAGTIVNLLNTVLQNNHAGFTLPAVPTSNSSIKIGGPNGASLSIHGINGTSGRDAAAVSTIREYLGTPYVWGGESPKGFDCSGLLQYVWGKQGVQIPRTSQQQWQTGQSVNASQLRPGDAVFFVGSDGSRTAPGHVGMYIGDGKYVEAPHTGDVVKIANLRDAKDFVGARRYA